MDDPAGVDDYALKWQSFAAIALSFITIVASTSMTFLMLPAIADDFDVTLGAVGWVVIIGSLVVSALLLPMGSLADTIGRRRVLLVGMSIFGIGTVLMAIAPTFGLLIVARIIMAFGDALVQSIGTGLLVAAFPPGERGLALGAQTTAVAVGGAGGPLLAGIALDAVEWEFIFLALLIPTVLSIILIRAMIRPDEPIDRTAVTFDRLGSALSAIIITLLVVTITNPFDLSWLSFGILAPAIVGIALAVWFVRWELRIDQPMFELRLFKISVFRTAVGIRVMGFVSSTTTTLLLPVYLLSLRGFSATRAGLILFVVAVGLGLSAQLSGRMYDRVGPRGPSLVGLVLLIAANSAFAYAGAQTSLWVIAAIGLVSGISVGMWNVPNNSAMLGATPPAAFGVGGAFTNVTRTVGNLFGQAIATGVVVAVMRDRGFDIPLGDIDETPGAGSAFLDGWKLAFLVAAGLAAATLIVSTRLPGSRAGRGTGSGKAAMHAARSSEPNLEG